MFKCKGNNGVTTTRRWLLLCQLPAEWYNDYATTNSTHSGSEWALVEKWGTRRTWARGIDWRCCSTTFSSRGVHQFRSEVHGQNCRQGHCSVDCVQQCSRCRDCTATVLSCTICLSHAALQCYFPSKVKFVWNCPLPARKDNRHKEEEKKRVSIERCLLYEHCRWRCRRALETLQLASTVAATPPVTLPAICSSTVQQQLINDWLLN